MPVTLEPDGAAPPQLGPFVQDPVPVTQLKLAASARGETSVKSAAAMIPVSAVRVVERGVSMVGIESESVCDKPSPRALSRATSRGCVAFL